MIEWCGYKWDSAMEGGRLIHPDSPWQWYSERCSTVDSGGNLHLKIMKSHRQIRYFDGTLYSSDYGVGTLRTRDRFDYGTFSCEMKMPKGLNMSASFWLSGDDSWPPEIDIEEGWSEDGNWLHDTTDKFPWVLKSWRTTSNVVFLNKKGDKKSKKYAGSRNILRILQPLDPTENFIEYKCVWKPDSITFYANGKKVRKICSRIAKKLAENNEKPGHSMRAILNIWMGNPAEKEVRMDSELVVRNFKYTPLDNKNRQ
jgi:beta-glucanase (GH16 family)